MKRKVKEINMPNLTSGRDRTSKVNYEYLDLIPSTTLLEFAKNKKYFIRTYGCQGNIRDSEVLSGLLEKAGLVECQKVEESDVVIINTCAVRENAEDKVYGEIGILKNIKEKIN